MRTLHKSVTLASVGLALVGCGRDVAPSDVKLLSVGNNPEEIGPSPDPYGGIIEVNHVRFGGGALPLSAVGLNGYTAAGPSLLSMAPPYDLVFGLAYMFDTRLRGAANLALVTPNPPPVVGACYTQLYPEGPFDSGFNTVDVGDAVSFRELETGELATQLGRFPRDYPPESSRLSVAYQAVEGYSPEVRTTFVPGDSSDPLDMVEVPYRNKNFPFGAAVGLEWPGGFTSFDKPVASIPKPYRATDPASPTIVYPNELGPVTVSWQGERYQYDISADAYVGRGEAESEHNTCFEFLSPLEVAGGGAPGAIEDCATPTKPPTDPNFYNSFRGQMYTGPWEAEEGVTFRWLPEVESTDTYTFAVKFLAPIDREAEAFMSRQAPANPDDAPADWVWRSAQICETEQADNATYRFDEERWAPTGELAAVLQGDPNEVIAQVVCNIDPSDGSFVLTQDLIADAYDYAVSKGAAGSLFMLSRQQKAEIDIPAVKDPYDQRHDVNPVLVTAKSIRLGRFFWTNGADASAQGDDQ